MMPRVAIFCCDSSGGVPSSSIEWQESVCRSLAERAGFVIVAVLVADDAVIQDRLTGESSFWPDAGEMVAGLDIDVLILENIDVLFDVNLFALNLIMWCVIAEVAWFSVREGRLPIAGVYDAMISLLGYAAEDPIEISERGLDRPRAAPSRRPEPGDPAFLRPPDADALTSAIAALSMRKAGVIPALRTARDRPDLP